MTFSLPTLLAHGALGIWDEIIFLGVVVIFVVMMGISWVRSRFDTSGIDAHDDAAPRAKTTDTLATETSDDRFKLE